VLDVVEISLAEMTKAVVMLGNSQLRAEMDSIDPVNTGQLPQTLIPVVRECLDSITTTRTCYSGLFYSTMLESSQTTMLNSMRPWMG
jgi:hypothetical protein